VRNAGPGDTPFRVSVDPPSFALLTNPPAGCKVIKYPAGSDLTCAGIIVAGQSKEFTVTMTAPSNADTLHSGTVPTAQAHPGDGHGDPREADNTVDFKTTFA